eukprot:TRINITY_DN16009_c0_g2_i13.p3 TRINITY_DN16009_c0_g2~~TRINITY_DN16009_c0_g2_i13.p3  ORF type:complete len:107 (+),score=26.59 TRINITY_DN16009_c0_g2_i13:65-385(+)
MLVELISKAAGVLNDTVGHALMVPCTDPESPPELSQGEVRIPVSLEEFGHPKRRGNTLTTRSKTAPYKLATALVELKILGFDSMLNTLLHELGHALGLHAHLEDNG